MAEKSSDVIILVSVRRQENAGTIIKHFFQAFCVRTVQPFILYDLQNKIDSIEEDRVKLQELITACHVLNIEDDSYIEDIIIDSTLRSNLDLACD